MADAADKERLVERLAKMSEKELQAWADDQLAHAAGDDLDRIFVHAMRTVNNGTPRHRGWVTRRKKP